MASADLSRSWKCPAACQGVTVADHPCTLHPHRYRLLAETASGGLS
eukprot:CAMPEP_0202809382 /NCGR_PEP_ID=MMETSP1389-20130828/1698_1 /ASSEMBLY_ACC=CAM_ASM_000865 /TAXON_ID=302021 /ORGANISM="Rhodomonas sp., Strain CCMP768" /LENGTH=45 /DNA_ID= /DNA_START= /DNA_END= /DNA_ORIENTATION=